mgnify:CR=1 FL=1
MHPHEQTRANLEALRLENENTAFRLGHLTASFERIIQQADELAMRRQLAWGRCVEAARQGGRHVQEVAEQETGITRI